MRSKKVLAILLSVALLVSVMPLAGLILPTAAETTDAAGTTPTDLIAYVDTSVEEGSGSWETGEAYPTLSAAITALNDVDDTADTVYNRIVKIKDTTTYSVYDNDQNASGTNGTVPYGAFPAHEYHITIEGASGTSNTIDVTDVYSIGGPTTFDNITYTAASTSSEFYLGGFELELGANAVAAKKIRLRTGINIGVASARGTAHKLVMRGNDNMTTNLYTYSYTGDSSTSGTYSYPGTTFVMYGGTVGKLYFGATNKTVTYTSNYNFEINGGTIDAVSTGPLVRIRFDEGKALQIIFNNGVTNDNLPRTFTDANGVTQTAYVLNCDANLAGATLSAIENEEAGVYQVNGNAVPVVTATDGSAVDYTYADGRLDLTAVGAGEYNVSWTNLTGDLTAYVDSVNGSDDNAGTENAPFATLTKAITELNNQTDSGITNRIVKIMDETYSINSNDPSETVKNWGEIARHDYPITIEGADGTNNVLNISKSVNGGGDLKFDNITYEMSSTAHFNAQGYAVEFGENAKAKSKAGRFGIANSNDSNSGDTTGMALGSNYSLKLKGSNHKFNYVYLMGYKTEVTFPGIDFVMDGGEIGTLYFGASSTANNGKTTYTGNVNLEFNGGEIGTFFSGFSTGRDVTFTNEAALQLIFNNDMIDKGWAIPEVSLVEDEFKGKMYVLDVAANDGGSTLSANEGQTGVYTINKLGSYLPIVTNSSGTDITEFVYNAEDGTIDVSAYGAGTYTVTWGVDESKAYNVIAEENDIGTRIEGADGVYTVTNYGSYWPVVKDADGNALAADAYTYDATTHTLTIHSAGSYTVGWERARLTEVYVGDGGSDVTNDGTSANARFATLATAMQCIQAAGDVDEAAAGTISIVGTLTVTDPFAMASGVTSYTEAFTVKYTVPVTIRGNESTASKLDLTGVSGEYVFYLFGDTTFDDITVAFGDYDSAGKLMHRRVIAHHYELNFAAGTVVEGAPQVFVASDRVDGNYKNRPVPSDEATLTLDGVSVRRAILGYYVADTANGFRTVAGVNLVLNNATVSDYIHIGNLTYNGGLAGGAYYTDDVNITFNGTKNNVKLLRFHDSYTTAEGGVLTTFNGNAVQIILNDGNTVTLNDPSGTAGVAAFEDAVTKRGGVLYVLNCDTGVNLTATEEAGTYAVEAGEIAVATNAAGAIVAVSANGYLTVPAGEYTVSYETVAPYTLSDDGLTLTVNSEYDITVDFAGIPVATGSALFLGWYNGDAPASAELAAGTVLTAESIADWNTDGDDEDYEGDNFFMYGSSLRMATDSGTTQALRFIVQLDRTTLAGIDEAVGSYGTVEKGVVVLPNDILGVKKLVKGGVYSYKNTNYSAAKVVGTNLFQDNETDTFIQYTAALTGIAEKNYLTAYAACGYITYTDANGVEQTVYTEQTEVSSINEVAEKLYEDSEYTDTYCKDLIDAAKDYVLDTYAYTSQPLSSADAGTLYSSNSANKLSEAIDENGVFTSAQDGQTITYSKINGEGSLALREITVEAVGENSNIDDTVIMQLTDLHMNYCNEKDFIDNDPWTMASFEERFNSMNGTTTGEHSTIDVHKAALKYAAAVGDQTVLTGDLIDYISNGNFELIERYISGPYSNALMLLGNHDPVRSVGNKTIDGEREAQYYDPDVYFEELQKVWNNDLYYTSQMVGKEVMVIQMNNATPTPLDDGTEGYTFYAQQVAKLTEDLKAAQENGYTALIFTHVPFGWEGISKDYNAETNPNGQELLYGTGGIDSSYFDVDEIKQMADTEPTKQVYDLLIKYADVIGGIFNGHKHNDVYSVIKDTNSDGDEVSIPQFTLAANFLSGGNVLKINVTDKDGEAVLAQEKTVHYTSNDGNDTVYTLGSADAGLTVREVTLNLGLGEDALEIVQINDSHLNYTAGTRNIWEACLRYAGYADYIVANGDIVDTPTDKLLNYLSNSLIPYADKTMLVAGNHETDALVTDGVVDYSTLEPYWTNNVAYSSVVRGKVMLIQMDNSQGTFTNEQKTWLEGRLTEATTNKYNVLLFVHIPLQTNDATYASVDAVYTNESAENSANYTAQNFNQNNLSATSSNDVNAAVCTLIANNSSVIKGVFAGHMHSDFYVEIAATDGTVIPEYVVGAAKLANGHALKINLK